MSYNDGYTQPLAIQSEQHTIETSSIKKQDGGFFLTETDNFNERSPVAR